MSNSTPRSAVLTRIFDAISRFGEILFHRADARARSCGWAVTSTHRGLGRSYRDPRFDTLRHCPRCAGSGKDPLDHDCPHCFGAGRIVHDPRPAGRGAR